MKAHQTGQIRIIGGTWRGRRLKVIDRPGLRPTPDRLRETLFNWLAPHLPGARCLDLFAGSGALGLEAVSRGARHCTLIDADRQTTQRLHEHATLLEAIQVDIQQMTAQQFLQQAPQAFDVVFLDPPFASDLLEPCIQQLSAGWLAEDARVYIEASANCTLPPLPATWNELRSQQSGQTRGHLFLLESLEPEHA